MTFVIAEVGSNWETLTDCLDSIGMAKNCGADAIKFQLFTHEELYGSPRQHPVFVGTEELKTALPKDWLPKLKLEADAIGIELMCTAFSPEGVDYVDQFVRRHKIASSELSHPPLLERVRGKNKPVLLSTGGSSLSDVRLARSFFEGRDLTLLYCVSSYPAKEVNLYGIDFLRREFPAADVGYSCHTANVSTPVLAVHHHKACVIEKHFKLRSDMLTPDSGHSLDPQSFKLMVKQIRGNPLDYVSFPSKAEQDMLTKHNRRLIATSKVSAGEELVFDKNFGIYRSLVHDVKGLTGFAYQVVNSKVATRDLEPGEAIGPGNSITPFELPRGTRYFAGVDWGTTAPFVVG